MTLRSPAPALYLLLAAVAPCHALGQGAPVDLAPDPGTALAATVSGPSPDPPEGRPPLLTILADGLYGAAAGGLVGAGISLIEQGHFGRDVAVGAGVGLMAGAVYGSIQAYSREKADRVAFDGQGSPVRDPVLNARFSIGLVGGRF